MREINECTAEVFRRSEKRIKERKRNRNRILALCILLCLIVTVWSVTILPAMLPAGMDNAAEGENIGSINDVDGTEKKHIYVSVEVKSTDTTPEYYCKIADVSAITEVYEHIFYAFDTNDAYNDRTEVPEQDAANDELKDYDSNTSKNHQSYTITMTSADGIDRIYVLNGNTLCDVSFDVEITLTEEQLAGLKAALGLTD